MATLRETFKDIADAIRSKGIDGTMKPIEMASKIGDIQTGGQEVLENDVTFYRPDGKILYSYTKDEVLADGWELPEQPDWTIEWKVGLYGENMTIDQIPMSKDGWNWTKDKIIACVNAMGKCNIAGDYHPTDDNAHILIDLDNDSLLDFRITYQTSYARGATVYWGDGSSNIDAQTSGTRQHIYSSKGLYHLILEPSRGTLTLGVTDTYYSLLGEYRPHTRYRSPSVKYIVCGKTKTSGYMCQGMNLLEHIIFSRYTDITNDGNLCSYCPSLEFVSIPYYGKDVILKMDMFRNCVKLSNIALSCDQQIFQQDCFYYCQSLRDITAWPLCRLVGTYVFHSCYALKKIQFVPSTSSKSVLGSTFYNCYSLYDVVLSDDIQVIEQYAFYYCYSLSQIVFPSGLTSIATQAFYNCQHMKCYDFRLAAQVPTLANKSAFYNIQADCKIVVPDALYDTWITSTNWSDSTIVGHIIKASEYEG